MYFAKLSENFMSVCDKYFHFVFNITGNTSSDFLQKTGEVFFASRAFQGEVYSIRASISPQSPSSLDPEISSRKNACYSRSIESTSEGTVWSCKAVYNRENCSCRTRLCQTFKISGQMEGVWACRKIKGKAQKQIYEGWAKSLCTGTITF